jgi:hypothetical protein
MKFITLQTANRLNTEISILREYLKKFEDNLSFEKIEFDKSKVATLTLRSKSDYQPEFLTKVATEEFDYALKRIITATQKRIIELETELENL